MEIAKVLEDLLNSPSLVGFMVLLLLHSAQQS